MYNFEEHLLENEKILYQGRPVPGKGGKGVLGFIFIILFCLIIQGILIWSIVFKVGDGANGLSPTYIMVSLILLVIIGIAIREIYYDLFKKKKDIADEFYCITNLRVLKYKEKDNNLVFGYLDKYDSISYGSVKDGFGDVYFEPLIEEDEKPKNIVELKKFMNCIKTKNYNGTPYIVFASIEKPFEVIKLAIDARDNILQDNNQNT